MNKQREETRLIRLNNQHKALKFNPKKVKACLLALDSFYKKLSEGELSVVFMDDESLAQLHDRFSKDPTKTDVITFQGDPFFEFAGEICVSVDRAQCMSEKLHNDFSREVTLYLVHGFLHLIGYDDIDPADRAIMKKEEKKALAFLDSTKSIPSFLLE